MPDDAGIYQADKPGDGGRRRRLAADSRLIDDRFGPQDLLVGDLGYYPTGRQDDLSGSPVAHRIANIDGGGQSMSLHRLQVGKLPLEAAIEGVGSTGLDGREARH